MSETQFSKAELRSRIEAGYRQFEAILAPLTEEQMTTIPINGDWTIKDNLAHLTVWQDYLLTRLQAVINRQHPPEFFPASLTTEDEQNEYFYQKNKDRPLSEVLADFRASYQRVLATIQAMSEESLTAPVPWKEGGDPLWPSIVGNTYGHYEEHGDIIKRWQSR